MKKVILSLGLCLIFTGCLIQPSDVKLPNFNTNSNNVGKIDDSRGVIPKIVESLKDASKEDCLHHAKVFLGLSEFLKNSKAITKTTQLAPPSGVVGSIQKDYGWEISKNKTFTDLIEADMTNYLELKKPRDIDDTLRVKMVETFSLYGKGALKAASGK